MTEEGSKEAQRLVDTLMEACDSEWRGLGIIPGSGLRLRDEWGMYDARKKYQVPKMAVRANVPHVDPVGACVGINGARVKNIVNELGNEQIDIVEWDDNPAQLIVNALSPAKVVSAVADEEEKKAKIIVSEQQLSLAIGKSGQNVRLAAKLTGYGIDIKSEADPEAFADMDKDNAEIVYGEDSEGYNDNQADDVMPLDEDYNEDAASDTEVVEE